MIAVKLNFVSSNFQGVNAKILIIKQQFCLTDLNTNCLQLYFNDISSKGDLPRAKLNTTIEYIHIQMRTQVGNAFAHVRNV